MAKRMAAVNMAHYNRESAQHVADSLMQCPNRVLMWVRQFEEGGIDALRDLPRSERPPRIDGATMDNILSEAGQAKTTRGAPAENMAGDGDPAPHNVCQKADVQGRTLRQDGIKVRANRAGNGTVNSWRHRTKRRIARLKKAGFAIAAADEAFFIHNDSAGRKYWSPIGITVRIPHGGDAGG